MYIAYYDCGTTNTRAYLLHYNKICQSVSEAVGIKDFALDNDKSRLIITLHEIFTRLVKDEGIMSEHIDEIIFSGMISSPSGLVEIEHITAPVSLEKLKSSVVEYYEAELFHRKLKIIPGIKTARQDERVMPEQAPAINMMRGEETEIFGVIRDNPDLQQGDYVLVLPGSHTQAVLLRDGVIHDISSNITGELFNVISTGTILGASINGEESWEIHEGMVKLGAGEVHRTGFNRALYILRIQDLFTNATLNERRSYLEGVLNVGVMDAISCMVEKNCIDSNINLMVAGDNIQKDIYHALCEIYRGFHVRSIRKNDNVPYCVSGILSLTT